LETKSDSEFDPLDSSNHFELFLLVKEALFQTSRSIQNSYQFFEENSHLRNQIENCLKFMNEYLDFTFPFASREYELQTILTQIHDILKRVLNLGFQGFYSEGLSSLRSSFEWILKVSKLEIDYRLLLETGNKGKIQSSKIRDWKKKFQNYFLKSEDKFNVKSTIEYISTHLCNSFEEHQKLKDDLNKLYSKLSKYTHLKTIGESPVKMNRGLNQSEFFPLVKQESFIEYCEIYSECIGYIALLLILIIPELVNEEEAKELYKKNPNLILPIEGYWVGFTKYYISLIPKDYRSYIIKEFKKHQNGTFT
jgi:hypothetical protein